MPRFTADWFTSKTQAWLDHVIPRLCNKPNVRWLEIGSYEGLSALWTLDHVLTGPGAMIFCVDIFDPVLAWAERWGSIEYAKYFDENTAGIPNLIKLKGTSQTVLRILEGQSFQGAYLDGCHSDEAVTGDLKLLWPLLDKDAILVCDDYACPTQPEAGIAIDRFLASLDTHHEVLFKDFQIIVRKVS
jgi:predicted O-methyltransferase YrrM